MLPMPIDQLREVEAMLDREYAMAGKTFAGRAPAMSSIQLRGELRMAVHDDALPTLEKGRPELIYMPTEAVETPLCPRKRYQP
jgi:hypothetical protein